MPRMPRRGGIRRDIGHRPQLGPQPRRIVPPVQLVPIALGAAGGAPIASLVNHGGPVIGSVEVVPIYWGAAWGAGANAALTAALDGFFDFIVTSAYMDLLTEYSTAATRIGHGSRPASARVINSEPGTVTPGGGRLVTDAQIQTAVQGFIANQTVPASTANTVYFVFLPPNVVSDLADGSTSCGAFCGYHSNIGKVYYAVIPFVNCSGCTFGGPFLDTLTEVCSHELAEAITDPELNAWFDPATGNEIGDVCNRQTKRFGGFLVQTEWSNAQQACALVPPVQPGDHFYTTSLPERDNAIAQDGYQSEGTACFVSPNQTAGTVPLHRLLNAATGDHFYTTSDAERDNAIAQDGYQSEGEACFVSPNQTAETTPFHRLFNGDHFYTTSDAERDNAIAQYGYQNEGEACFVFANDPSGRGALYRLFNPGSGDHFYTTSLPERDNAIANYGYQSEGEACFVSPNQTAGTVPLHRLFNAATGDHFYTTSDAERDNAIAQDGYQSEGEACFVSPNQTAGTTPLHRLLNAATGDHFYTTSDAERDNAIAQYGYQNEGEACFVFANDPSGQVALYRLFH